MLFDTVKWRNRMNGKEEVISYFDEYFTLHVNKKHFFFSKSSHRAVADCRQTV